MVMRAPVVLFGFSWPPAQGSDPVARLEHDPLPWNGSCSSFPALVAFSAAAHCTLRRKMLSVNASYHTTGPPYRVVRFLLFAAKNRSPERTD
jgi:hypothetical protein